MNPNLPLPRVESAIKEQLYAFKRAYDHRSLECKPVLSFATGLDDSILMKTIRRLAAQLDLASCYTGEGTVMVFYLQNIRPVYWKEWRQFFPDSNHSMESVGVSHTQDQFADQDGVPIVEGKCCCPVKYTEYHMVTLVNHTASVSDPDHPNDSAHIDETNLPLCRSVASSQELIENGDTNVVDVTEISDDTKESKTSSTIPPEEQETTSSEQSVIDGAMAEVLNERQLIVEYRFQQGDSYMDKTLLNMHVYYNPEDCDLNNLLYDIFGIYTHNIQLIKKTTKLSRIVIVVPIAMQHVGCGDASPRSYNSENGFNEEVVPFTNPNDPVPKQTILQHRDHKENGTVPEQTIMQHTNIWDEGDYPNTWDEEDHNDDNDNDKTSNKNFDEVAGKENGTVPEQTIMQHTNIWDEGDYANTWDEEDYNDDNDNDKTTNKKFDEVAGKENGTVPEQTIMEHTNILGEEDYNDDNDKDKTINKNFEEVAGKKNGEIHVQHNRKESLTLYPRSEVEEEPNGFCVVRSKKNRRRRRRGGANGSNTKATDGGTSQLPLETSG